jgi:hypothetical protein
MTKRSARTFTRHASEMKKYCLRRKTTSRLSQALRTSFHSPVCASGVAHDKMDESSSSIAERKPYQNWRSQASSNWRKKDETPRPEQPARTQQRSFDQRKDVSSPPAGEATPGTRLYVGNLLYSAQPTDVEQFFADNGFQVAQINMSTDPFTGRNPSYCFVDLETVELASEAMAVLNGQEVLGRPVKINPGVKKSFGSGSTSRREWGSRDGTPTRATCKDLASF